EFFPEPPQSTSPSPSPGPASPSHVRRRHSPRAGPHASPPPPPRGRARARGVAKASDVWTFFENSQDGSKRDCAFCKQRHSVNPRATAPKPFASSTSTGVLRRHLYEQHLEAWVEGCDRLKIPITAKDATPHVNGYRERKNQATNGGSTSASDKKRTPFTQDGFVDAIVEWIVSDDQSINVIENEQLRNIFLMLRAELNDSDIPHRTKIRKRVIEIWDEHLSHLESEMGVCFYSIFSLTLQFIQLGWVTLDNASNNDTFMVKLAAELRARNIPFDMVNRRIRCFPHIVNLACKAVLSAITDMDFAASDAPDFDRNAGEEPYTFLDAVARDPVATIRTSIRASSLRRQYFSEVLKALQQKDLQLLRDVDTRWSSTLLMMDRAILLRKAIDKFLEDAQWPDLVKYKLSDKEWEALDIFRRILAVPHAFQQKLSAEKTPTLGNALPAFEAMISQWEKQKTQYPEAANIIQQGIDKLTTYRERVEDVPAYILSMREFIISYCLALHSCIFSS
ncbi:ribonuclease H-like domain-containing protein, partial [Favolaschia claudopus]